MLYFLDTDPQRAARLLADVDVRDSRPMTMLAKVLHDMRIHVRAGVGVDCRLAQWVTRCVKNWDWTMAYTQEVVNEHIYRFDRLHPATKNFHAILTVDEVVRARLPQAGQTLPPSPNSDLHMTTSLAMLAVSHVTQWRWFYGEERRGALYTKRATPDFIEERRVQRERRREARKEVEDRRHPVEEDHGHSTQTYSLNLGRIIRTRTDVRIRRVRAIGKEGDDHS